LVFSELLRLGEEGEKRRERGESSFSIAVRFCLGIRPSPSKHRGGGREKEGGGGERRGGKPYLPHKRPAAPQPAGESREGRADEKKKGGEKRSLSLPRPTFRR